MFIVEGNDIPMSFDYYGRWIDNCLNDEYPASPLSIFNVIYNANKPMS